MLLLGIDIGTSFIKVAVVDANSRQCIASAQYPEQEAKIISIQAGYAEQCPESWWQYTLQALQNLHATHKYDPKCIAGIGISYQMHGLVITDRDHKVLRDAIIWCDSRATETGRDAFEKIGEERCSNTLLNSPGNFTASKLAWVKQNETDIYNQADKVMLPGDFISMRLTGKITTTPSALSEGIFWDFEKNEISKDVLQHFEFNENIIPEVKEVFSLHGYLHKSVAAETGLNVGTPVTYKAGDQLNNALSLNVLKPGEVAATAGTSGVIYAVTDKNFSEKKYRVNVFAHVNHDLDKKRLGVLLCINGCGIMNSWIKKLLGDTDYGKMNIQAMLIPPGSEGLMVLPFGNGSERMLDNTIPAAQISGIDLIKHRRAHIYRAAQEGIAFAFRYGLDIMRENGIDPKVIRAAKANMFLSDVFIEAFVNATGVTVELFDTNGSIGAALGAGIGAGIFSSTEQAFDKLTALEKIEPTKTELYEEIYKKWKVLLPVQPTNGVMSNSVNKNPAEICKF